MARLTLPKLERHLYAAAEAESPNNYTGFFVPKAARWSELRDNLHVNVW